MKNDRLMALLDCLLLEGHKTSSELASRFEVSERTIYRDIDSLCMAGVPVISGSGPGGGYSIDSQYRIDRGFLTPGELADLTALLKGFSEATQDRNLRSSLSKIAALGRRDAGGPDMPPPLVVSLAPWGAASPDPGRLLFFRQAITGHRVVALRYRSPSGAETEREVEPFSLVVAGTAWYLHAWCRLRASFRLFKIARIQEYRNTLSVFDPQLRRPVPSPFLMDGDADTFSVIQLSAGQRLWALLDETFGPGSPSDTGERLYQFEYPLGPYLVGLLLSFGPGLRVLKPDCLRIDLARAAEGIACSNS